MSQYATFGSLSYQPTPNSVGLLKKRILAHPGPISELERVYTEETVHIKNEAHSHEVWVVFRQRKEQLLEAAKVKAEKAAAKAQAEEAAAKARAEKAAAKAQAEEAAAKARAEKATAALYEEMRAALAEIRARNARAEEALAKARAEEALAKAQAEEAAAKAQAEEVSRHLEELHVKELARVRALSGFLFGILKALVPGAFWV